MKRGPKPKGIAERFWPKVKIGRPDECWPWTGYCDWNGYGKFRINEPRRKISAHVMAFILTNGPVPVGKIVRHGCDNPPCCNPDHLLSGTHADNTRDKFERNRGGAYRLKDYEVREIRRRLKTGESQKTIAADFEVASVTICAINVGQNWRWLS